MKIRFALFGKLFVGSLSFVLVACGQPFELMDTETPAYLELAQAEYAFGETETNLTVTILRTGDFRRPASVVVATVDGSAEAGLDYVARELAIVIPAGHGMYVFSVELLADRFPEPEETFFIELREPGPYTQIIGGRAEIVITDAPFRGISELAELEIQAIERGLVRVSWPAGHTGVLEKSTGLGATDWAAVTGRATLSDGRYIVQDVRAGQAAFYRLRRTDVAE